MISVLIPTRNEELDLPGCLDSVAWCDDVHVYDSGSTDATVAIARAHGARVTVSPIAAERTIFGGDESAHKNWALDNLPFKYPWVLHIDADERVTPELAESLPEAVSRPGDAVGFRVERRDFFEGRWLKHVQTSSFYLRLFQPRRLRYERVINPVSRPLGPVGQVRGYLDHHPFSKGLDHWIEKHNAYSSLEAKQILSDRIANSNGNLLQALLARDSDARRAHQKALFYRLPARPLVKFTALYFAKGGFLDGRPGFMYAALQAFYEFLIVLKTRELSRQPQPPDTWTKRDTASPSIAGSTDSTFTRRVHERRR